VVRLVEKPRFSPKKEFARHVAEEDRLRGGRTAMTAFIDPPADDPTKDYLSVNSLEVERVSVIAQYYRDAFQEGEGPVTICTSSIEQYTNAGKKCEVPLVYDESAESWMFISGPGPSQRELAYTHRAVVKRPDGLVSPSHCGVEFVRVMNEHARAKFARRLSGLRYHIFFRSPPAEKRSTRARRR
jgi:hypothetical protein